VIAMPHPRPVWIGLSAQQALAAMRATQHPVVR